MSSSLAMASPSFLKKLDAVFGRIGARILPQPVRRSSPSSLSSILVIRPGGIGDAALVAPLIAVLADRYPSAGIDILAERRNAGVFCLIPGIRKLFLYDRPVELFHLLRVKYDLVIDTEQWHRLSAVVARLAGADYTIGFDTNERSRLFTSFVSYSHEHYEAQSFLNLLSPLGIQVVFNPAVHFLEVPASAAQEIADLPVSQCATRYVTIFPGASISERHWGTDKFRHLASRFRGAGLFPVVIGGESERLAGNEIIADGGLNYAGRTTLAGSACLISRASLLVSSDSGILHIGAGLGIPTVALFGPGIAEKWGPCGPNTVIIDKGMDCSPCTKFGYTPTCPFNARCMAEISVDDVYRAATGLLNKI